MQAQVLYSAVSVLLSRYCSARLHPGFYFTETKESIMQCILWGSVWCFPGIVFNLCSLRLLLMATGTPLASRLVAEMLLYVEVNLI